MNPIGLVTELRNRHNEGEFAGGINVKTGAIIDMWKEKIVQPLLVNTSEISLATECVGMILKIGKYYDGDMCLYTDYSVLNMCICICR
jgi:T-complex protein 1 subunit delta